MPLGIPFHLYDPVPFGPDEKGTTAMIHPGAVRFYPPRGIRHQTILPLVPSWFCSTKDSFCGAKKEAAEDHSRRASRSAEELPERSQEGQKPFVDFPMPIFPGQSVKPAGSGTEHLAGLALKKVF
jgi:hypothetical protein